MGCLTGMVRTIMFVFNFACLGVGVVLMAVGGFFYVSVDKYHELIEGTSGLNVVPSLTIAVGVIVFLIAFLGCCGAMKNSSCMLISYAIILIVILIVQFAGGIYGIVHMNNNGGSIKTDVTKEMKKQFNNVVEGDKEKENVITTLFQSMQSELSCCGVDGPDDYQNILSWPQGKYPGGCCGDPNAAVCPVTPLDDKFSTDGCANKLFETIDGAVKVVAIVAIVICAVELLGAIFAICLVRSK